MLSLGMQPLCSRPSVLAGAVASPGARGKRCPGAARGPQHLSNLTIRSRAFASDDDEASTSTSTSSSSSSTSASTLRGALFSAAKVSFAAAAAAAIALSASASPFVGAAAAAAATTASTTNQQPSPSTSAPDFVTARAFLDVALCPSGYRPDRTLGDATALCSDPEPLGTLVLGLYGNAAPGTVSQFLALARGGELDGTLFHKVIEGSYVMAGKQGSRRMGELSPAWSELLPGGSGSSPGAPPPPSPSSSSSSSSSPPPPSSNPDLLSPSSFEGPLRHSRPGTLSLALGATDDDEAVRMRPGYRAAEFLVTTGPGPVPSLDGSNIVFGRVERGLAEVVGAMVSRVKVLGATPGPFGDLARAIGDERVRRVTAKYGRPLQLVVITKAGVLYEKGER